MKNLLLFCGLILTMISCGPVNDQQESGPYKKLVVSDSSLIAHPVDYIFPQKETFTVMTWNVEHFVDPFDDPYINNRREDNPSEEMGKKVNLLIEALRRADADVVVFQEFESEKYLMALARDSFPDLGYQFFSDAASPDWYMNVVLMSRFPLGTLHAYGDVNTPVTDYVDEKGKRQTQSYINTRMWSLQIFPSSTYNFWLTGVHLKAGRSERDVAMRIGQIEFLQFQFEQLLRVDPSANLLMAGDFNAYPDSQELLLLTSPEQQGAAFLDLLDSATFTHPADSAVRRLDYVLFNDNMSKELVAGSTQVRYFFAPDSMRIVSDHLPVLSEFYKKDLP